MTTLPMAAPGWGSARDLNDSYLTLLLFALWGYALFGRGFAYAGIPPVFIGEVVLALGVLAALRSGTLPAALATLPSLTLAAFVAWVAIRTLPYVPAYGVEALRDSVVAVYGAFAFIVAALLVERRQRLIAFINSYHGLASIFPYLFVVAFPISRLLEEKLPAWPVSEMPIIALRAGDSSVHIAGIAAFALLGFRRARPLWTMLLFIACMMAFSQNRGGMLSAFVACGIVVVLMPLSRKLISLGCAAVVFIAVGLAADVSFPIGSDRDLSFRQVASNVMTIVTPTDDPREQGTKEWRLQWWRDIIDYTLHGRYFWTGKGFGLNLAIDDGYQVNDPDLPPLRSPHNGHLTVLARGGVPGLVLWIAVCVSWAATMLRLFFIGRARGERAWSRLFLFLFAYWLAILINSSFDVALEGPMLGIWFWTLHGLGIGAAILYRAELKSLPAQLCRRRAA
jgi:hypothetical protein